MERVTKCEKENVAGKRIKRTLAMLAMSLMCTGQAFALEISGLDDLKGLATSIVGALGFIVGIYGGIQFGLGMANDNADSQSRGIKMLIGGVIICGATVLLKALKLTA